MAVERFRLKPSKTQWIGVEIIVNYSCEAEPEVKRVKVTGLKQFGLILSHEYDIDVHAHSARKTACDIGEDCQSSLLYEFDVKVFVSDVIGLGIGIGKLGTGTAGWSTKSTEQIFTFSTSCLCCDEEKTIDRAVSEVKLIPAAANAIPWFLGFAGMGTALAWAGLNFDHPSLIPRIVICSTASGMVLSLGVAVARLVQFFRRRMSLRSAASLDKL